MKRKISHFYKKIFYLFTVPSKKKKKIAVFYLDELLQAATMCDGKLKDISEQVSMFEILPFFLYF